MMLDLAQHFTLALGIHVDSGPVALRRRFSTAWGKTEVFVSHQVSHDLARERVWQHQTGWALRLALDHVTPYGLRLEALHEHRYDDLPQHRLAHRAAWSELGELRKTVNHPYWLTESLTVHHQLTYAVTDSDPVKNRFLTGWTLLADQRLQAVNNSPELSWQGRKLRLISATLSADEDSPVWLARLQLADVGDFAAMAIGDALRLALGQEIFELIVDGKSLSRDAVTDLRCEISAVSPLALLDAPFSGTMKYFRPEPTPAVEAVTFLIGAVDWQLPHWLIPAGRLLMEDVTPLQAARNIVAAMGGIIESHPEGSVVCRRRHPDNVPDYASASIAHTLFDGDVISAQSRIAPSRGYNRVTLANEEGGGARHSDTLEFIVNENVPTQGLVRAYLNPARSVTLAHSGHPSTKITALGDISRSEKECVEFIEGQARTRYPITQIVSVHWQHADLGTLHFNDKALTASTMGYSLLALTYLTYSVNWAVSLTADEEVQFVLIDN